MKKNIFGFTLIELLIVISIIAILAALAIFGIGNVFEKARNTQRKSDVKQYQNSLETFANSHDGLYPSRTNDSGVEMSTTLCGDLGLTGCPADPTYEAGVWDYSYETGGVGNGCGTPCNTDDNYVIWARLEASSNTFLVVCSNGKTGEMTIEPGATSGLCPLP